MPTFTWTSDVSRQRVAT